MTSEEAYLIEKCKKGSYRYQKQLYELYSGMVWSVCLRYLKNENDAQDAFQNAFIAVYKNIADFRGTGDFGAWVRKITVNAALMVYRSNKKSKLYVELDDQGVTSMQEDKILAELSAEDLMNAIKGLPDGYRVVFNLFGIEGYSHAEIAEKLNISESTSRSQFSRARKLLMDFVNKEAAKING